MSDELRQRVTACTAHAELRILAVDLAAAADLATVASLLARLPAPAVEAG